MSEANRPDFIRLTPEQQHRLRAIAPPGFTVGDRIDDDGLWQVIDYLDAKAKEKRESRNRRDEILTEISNGLKGLGNTAGTFP